jgi:hypothetical protein
MAQKYNYYRLRINNDSDPLNPREDADDTVMMICNHGRYTLGDKKWNNLFVKGRSLKETEAAMLNYFVPTWGTMVDEYESNISEDVDENTRGDLIDEFIEHKFDEYFVWQFLYLYDHSGITMSCGKRNPFECRWDSGVVGIAAVLKTELVKGWGIAITDEVALQEKGNALIESTVEVYTAYLEGQVYGYEVEQLRERRVVGGQVWEKPLVEFPRITAFGEDLFDWEGVGEGEDDDTEVPEHLESSVEWSDADSCWGFYGSDMAKNGILGEVEGIVYRENGVVKTWVEEAGQEMGKWILLRVLAKEGTV